MELQHLLADIFISGVNKWGKNGICLLVHTAPHCMQETPYTVCLNCTPIHRKRETVNSVEVCKV